MIREPLYLGDCLPLERQSRGGGTLMVGVFLGDGGAAVGRFGEGGSDVGRSAVDSAAGVDASLVAGAGDS